MSTSVQRSTGVVKWFNNKAGYGFLTLTSIDRTQEDIFVHHTSIVVGTDQFKYLVQGEYVDFVLSTDAGVHKYQATEVRGVNGGKLMCETQHNCRLERTTTQTSSRGGTSGRGGRGGQTSSRGGTSGRGGQTSSRGGSSRQYPVQSDDEKMEWFLVKRKRGDLQSSHRHPMAELE
jgi:cold shock CspA family protein